ncbi:MAG TPA: hypothetical protein VM662_08955 [Sphingomonas sp.]|nr:hypothetical protein [Sphingomonas sp.]
MKAAIILAALALGTQAAPGLDPALTVGSFIQRWTRVEGLKEMAKIDPDTRFLAQQIMFSLKAWKLQLEADTAAGKPPRACPVKGTTTKIDSKEILTALRAIPEEKRGTSFRDAMFAYLDARFPCRTVSPSLP